MKKLKELLDKNLYDDGVSYLNSIDLDEPIKLYNLGYISYKKGELAESILYLEKAKTEGFYSKEWDESMYKVKSELGLNIIESTYSKLDNVILTGMSIKPDVYYSIIVASLLVGLALFKFVNKYVSALSLVPVIVLATLLNIIKPLDVVINQEEVAVYRGPSRIFEQVATVSAGAKIIFSKESKDWKYIEYPQLYQGWVYKNKALQL